MMARWMCGVFLTDRKHREVLYSLLGIQSVADVVRRGRLRWFEHQEHKIGDDSVAYLGFHKGGKFFLATNTYTKFSNFFIMSKKIFLAKEGAMAQWPP